MGVQTVGMREKLSETCSCRSKEVLYCRSSLLPASWLLVGWGAFMVGLLQAIGSVTNALTVHLGLSAVAGGKTNATNQMVALTLLPLVGIFGDKVRASSSVLVVSSTAIAFVCSVLLILSQIIAL